MEDNEIIEIIEEPTEIIEEVTENIIVEEHTVPVIEEQQLEEHDLLIEYIKKQLEEEVEEEGEEQKDVQVMDSDNVNDLRSGSDPEPIDNSADILNELEIQTGYIEEYNRNNTLQSDINDISLTNTLLIVVFIGILFTAVLNFSRRIF